MPSPSFFDAMEANGGTTFAGPTLPNLSYEDKQNLKAKFGYKNQFGTDTGLSVMPGTGAVEGHLRFPIGSHETGWNAGVTGYVRPGGPAGSTDTGAMLTFGKVNRIPVGTADVLMGLDPAMRTQLENNPALLEALRRQKFDTLNNISVPGQNKFEGYAGFDTNTQRGLTPGSAAGLQRYNELLPAGAMPVSAPGLPMQMQEMNLGGGTDPQQFLRQNVNQLQQQQSGAPNINLSLFGIR
jgi:hypothetical protein